MSFAGRMLEDRPRALQESLLLHLLSQEQLRVLWQQLFTDLAPEGLLTGTQIEERLTASDVEALRAGNMAQTSSFEVMVTYWRGLKARLQLHLEPRRKGLILLKIYLGAAIAGNVELMQFVSRKGAFFGLGPWNTLPAMVRLTMANAQHSGLEYLFSTYPQYRMDWSTVQLIPRSRPDFVERVFILFIRKPSKRGPLLDKLITRELNSFPVNGPFLRVCLGLSSVNPNPALLGGYLRLALKNCSLVGAQTLLEYIVNPEFRKQVIFFAMAGLGTEMLATRLVDLVRSYL